MKFYIRRLLLLTFLITTLDGRRVRIQPSYDDDATAAAADDDVDAVQYYQPSQAQASQYVGGRGGTSLVYVTDPGDNDEYNTLYSRQQQRQDNYNSRQPARIPNYKSSVREPQNKPPPVQTIRNYNKVNDDGSFTFGYEAADGSFKEETRGTDCVVRGKYGYVDPDGNKREFTYVSGNPCDPNAPKDEDEGRSVEDKTSEEDDGPANYPTRPIQPYSRQHSIVLSTTTPAPAKAVSIFDNVYSRPQQQHQRQQQQQQQEEEEEEPEQVLRPQAPLIQVTPRHRFITRPVYSSRVEDSGIIQQTIRPELPSTTPAPPIPPTTYRPQLLQQYSVTPSRTPSTILYQPTPATIPKTEVHRFQHDNQLILPSTTRPTTKLPQVTVQPNSNPNPVYSSELVFDPASGQYNTALYQMLPQTDGDISLHHQIQPYVFQPQATHLLSVKSFPRQAPAPTTTTPRPSQAEYQQQQAELQFQNSQQLYAQQQRARQQQQQQQQQQQLRPEPQQFYYIQPQNGGGNIANGQIEAFLRGHNIQF